jgi:ABC-type phosphate transport system substrate-binding protein
VTHRWLLPAALSLVLAGSASAQEGFKVVVHPGIAGAQIRREALAALFLKKSTRWGDGRLARPVDQSARSAVRELFSQAVLRQPVAGVAFYWQREITSGRATAERLPPSVKGSDEEVLSFVKATEGAVGYVTAAAAVPDGVKVVKLVE